MSSISPLLQSRIRQQQYQFSDNGRVENHEEIYKDLQKHANDVKPNEAKAKLIKQGPVSAAFSAVKDTFQDGKNFKKAVKTGKLGDNNLGRLNDLGMKLGAVAIAAYLALNKSQTKTESIMKFVGGGTFFATMALWPKLAINLPARIVHGFNIGQRYTSAQGDKKDFFLDNQFLPWDAYSKYEMSEIGSRTGIDFYSDNGEEKIRRKMQKTALQNRTLWMATAGFATPLMTSLVGNAVEPKIKDAVITKGYENTRNIIQAGALGEKIAGSDTLVRNNKAIQALFNQYEGKEFDDKFFSTLADMLQLHAPEYKTKMTKDGLALVKGKDGQFVAVEAPLFKSADDVKPIAKFSGNIDETVVALKNMLASSSAFDMEKLEAQLKQTRDKKMRVLGEDKVKNILAALGNNPTEEALRETLENNNVPKQLINSLVTSTRKTKAKDSSEFLEEVLKYNTDTVGEVRGRIKAYIDLLNPVIGARDESVYTREYRDALGNLYAQMDLPYKSINGKPSLKNIHSSTEAITETLSDYFSAQVEKNPRGSEKYTNFLTGLLSENKARTEYNVSGFAKLLNRISNKENKNVFDEFFLKHIAPNIQERALKKVDAAIETASAIKTEKEEVVDALLENKTFEAVIPDSLRNPLTDAIFGKKEGTPNSIVKAVRDFCSNERVNLTSVETAPILCANFAAGLKNKKFGNLTAGDIEVIEKLLYGGNISYRNNQLFLANEKEYNRIIDMILKESGFNEEETVIKDIKQRVADLKNLSGSNDEKYRRAVALDSQFKTFLTNKFNNKHWERIFIPAALVLVGVTLLVQPFFGNIKKEYPDKGRQGGNK